MENTVLKMENVYLQLRHTNYTAHMTFALEMFDKKDFKNDVTMGA